MAKAKFSNRALTEKLRELMASVHDTRLNEDGEAEYVTKGERLAELICDRALGWEDTELVDTDVPGQKQEVTKKHRPERWAMELVWDRLEGKTPQALSDDTDRLTAADKVSELAKTKINKLTEETTDG